MGFLQIIVLFALLSLVSSTNFRLPDSLAPRQYTLEIIASLEPDFAFDGKVWIKVDCTKATKNITLHSFDLTISSAEVLVKSMETSSPLKIAGLTAVPENDFFIITLDEDLVPPKKYEVYIPFKGNMSKGLKGFYKSAYVDSATNTKKWISVTQFSPNDARRAFPCFDEPSFKSTFIISLGHKESLKALSNMPLKSTEPMKEKEGWIWSHFEETVPMSTYLVAYLVGEIEHLPPITKSNVTFTIWGRKDVVHKLDFALKTGPKYLSYMEDYFNISYSLPKVDIAAIPTFYFSAMENWGLITFRESEVIYDEEQSTGTQQLDTMHTLGHEIAHQWFGNLVTMKWWAELWLKEGFADFMSSYANDHLFPEANAFRRSALDALKSVLQVDALHSSHPILTNLTNPAQLSEIFDSISYRKAYLIIRMMNFFLGEKTMRQGLSNYVKIFKYRNTERDDLWQYLTEAAHNTKSLSTNTSVKEIMDTWILQKGYPLITVERNNNLNTVTIKQSRYLALNDDSKGCWQIPVTFTTKSESNFENTKPKMWLSCEKQKLEIPNVSPEDWIALNIDYSGLYRVNYDNESWLSLSAQLNSNEYHKIPPMSRAAILSDSLELAARGFLEYSMTLKMVQYLKREKDSAPWIAALNNLDYLRKGLIRTDSYEDFKVYMRSLLTPMYDAIGGSTSTTKEFDNMLLQRAIFSWSCEMGVTSCVKDSVKVFKDWMATGGKIGANKNFKDAIYCTALKEFGGQAWDFLWKRYAEENSQEKLIIISSVGCFDSSQHQSEFLNKSITDPKMDVHSVLAIFSSVGKYNLPLALNFLESHIGKVYERFGQRSSHPGKLLVNYGQYTFTEVEKDMWVSLIKKNRALMDYTARAADQSEEYAKINGIWSKNSYPKLQEALKSINK